MGFSRQLHAIILLSIKTLKNVVNIIAIIYYADTIDVGLDYKKIDLNDLILVFSATLNNSSAMTWMKSQV